MKEIIKVESKRVLKSQMFIVFLVSVILLSISSSFQAVKSYELWDEGGVVASGWENLKHGKENAGNRSIEDAIATRRGQEEAVFVDETNIEKLVALNYQDKTAGELSDGEINLFFENRLRTIERRLDENINVDYTESEKERFMKEAEKLTSLTVGFSEGWKVLNRDMGSFIVIILVMISIIIMPLFADETQTRMQELSRSAMKGKKQLNFARIITAYGMGSILYIFAVLLCFFIKMMPFGFSGANELIQSSENTFFSVFHISYMQQFIWNCLRGYVSLIFMVSLTMLISVMLEQIMAGIAAICFYWGLLLIMNQMISFEVNHMFANFMPLRLAGSIDFYNRNELYRFAGRTFDSIVWCPVVALILSIGMAVLAMWQLHRKTSEGASSLVIYGRWKNCWNNKNRGHGGCCALYLCGKWK